MNTKHSVSEIPAGLDSFFSFTLKVPVTDEVLNEARPLGIVYFRAADVLTYKYRKKNCIHQFVALRKHFYTIGADFEMTFNPSPSSKKEIESGHDTKN